MRSVRYLCALLLGMLLAGCEDAGMEHVASFSTSGATLTLTCKPGRVPSVDDVSGRYVAVLCRPTELIR